MNHYEAGEEKRIQELVRVEAKYQIAKRINTHPAARTTGIDGTMSRWLSGVLLRAQTPELAILAWRDLQSRGGREFPKEFSEKQREFLELSDAEICGFFAQALQFRETELPLLEKEIRERRTRKSGHGFNDKHQLKQEDRRSLERLREQGMMIQITPEFVELIREHYTAAAVCPVLDAMKNEPILTINGFSQSKVALTIHDMFDHFWTFHQFERAGLLAKYEPFLKKVGNPHLTDIFKREGELVASIAYEWRSSFTPERDFRPVVSLSQIQCLFSKQQKIGFSNNQRDAFRIVESIKPESELAQRLPIIYSGVLIELMEQRRKHGYIRMLDETYQPEDTLSLLDPEYLSLVVEGAAFLCSSEAESRDTLFRINVLVEDFLVRSTQEGASLEMIVNADTITAFDPNQSQVSTERKEWLRKNFFHAATRINACA